MNNERRHKPEMDESILISLDQLSQTLEVMSQIVTRLKNRLENAPPSQEPAGHNRRSTDKLLIDAKEMSQMH